MRGVMLALMGLAACSAPPAPPVWTAEERAHIEAATARAAAREAQQREEAAAAERAITPAQRAQRALDAAKMQRENELLERALSGSPDYTAAVSRAAVANVDGQAAIPSAPSERRPAVTPRTREAAIRAEEARLSEAVEVRRRQRLTEQAQQARGQQDQMAAAQCIALGQQIEASMYSRRSLLNLEGAIAGAQARDQCWANYQQTRR